eukprot:COSAG01_NODE_41799_length_447_cov_0.732759_2_plen_31_part_01
MRTRYERKLALMDISPAAELRLFFTEYCGLK